MSTRGTIISAVGSFSQLELTRQIGVTTNSDNLVPTREKTANANANSPSIAAVSFPDKLTRAGKRWKREERVC